MLVLVRTAVGTHLGHNIPDETGNRFCINLVCIAGSPDEPLAKPPGQLAREALLQVADVHVHSIPSS